MTSSFQSTAFQSSASPVDTFVRPPSVQPKTDIEQLAEALQSINPAIQSFIGSRLEKAAEKEEAEGTELAIEDAAKNFKDISRGVKKADGEDAARQLIGGSIFADRAYQKTKTEILGNNLASTLSNSYATTQVDGKSLNSFSLQSPQFQTWLEGERSRVVDQLGDINPTYVNKYFLPKLAEATATVTSSHIEQHQEYNLEKLKNLAVPLVKGLIVSDDKTDLQLITNFEQSMNNLGLVSKDRSDLNKTIVGVLIDQAEAVGLSGGGNIEGAENILDIALQFPYGVEGKLNLTAHPDYQNKVNDLKRSINNYIYEYENRKDVERKRIQREDTVNQLKQFAETGDAQIISDLIKKYPLDATKISTSGVAIDGNTLERSALVEFGMISGNYESSKEASIAALQWYQDSRTPKTVQNRNRLTQLLGTAESVERGDYTEINKGLTELLGQLKGEFSSSDFIVGTTGQLNDNGSRKVTDFYNKAKLELYQYRLSEEGKAANTLQIIEKIEAVKSKYIEQARKLNPGMSIQSGLDDGEKKKNREQNIDDMQGDANSNLEAGFFTEPTQEDIEREKALDAQEEEEKINFSNDSRVQSIVKAAKELGISPIPLAAVIAQESSFRPSVVSTDKATGKKYTGLIQFGPYEIAKYKIKANMTFEEQMVAVASFLKDRGVQPGHGAKEIYAAIFTGNVSNLDKGGADWADSNGTTVNKALPNLSKGGSKYKMAIDFLQQTGTYAPKIN